MNVRINEKDWWYHYQFINEPALGIDPLLTEGDLGVFVGREDEIRNLKRRVRGNSAIKVLVSGNAGIGKSSFVCKSFEGDNKFLRFDLGRAGNISLVHSQIAEDLLATAKMLENIQTDDIEARYMRVTTETTGTQSMFGGGPVPGAITSVNETTITSVVSPFHAREMGQQILNRMHNNSGRLTLFFDETDHIPGANRENLYSLLRLWNVPKPSTVIFSTRNIDATKSWGSPESIERQIFLYHLHLEEIWEPGSTGGIEVLDLRFRNCYVDNGSWQFPLSEDAISLIDSMAKGNVREFLRFTLQILIAGSDDMEKIPLSPSFAIKVLLNNFPSLRLSEEEKHILGYLRINPSYTSNETFIKKIGLPRSTLQERLSALEEKWFVTRKIENRKHIYMTTPKAHWLLDLQN